MNQMQGEDRNNRGPAYHGDRTKPPHGRNNKTLRKRKRTTTGHFIVLTGVDADGHILVHDPNSSLRSGHPWDIETLMPQIRDLWGYAT